MKTTLGILAIIIGIISYIPYFNGILKKTVKPHLFSWIIWGILTLIAFIAQLSDGGGAGAWVTGFTAIISFSIVFITMKNGFKEIAKTDWISFIGALLTIPLWLITKNPLYSVILITIIDALGFYPTFRKGYFRPKDDSVTTFFLSAIKFAVALFALQNYSAVTVLYPLSLVLMNGLFSGMLVYRRKIFKK